MFKLSHFVPKAKPFVECCRCTILSDFSILLPRCPGVIRFSSKDDSILEFLDSTLIALRLVMGDWCVGETFLKPSRSFLSFTMRLSVSVTKGIKKEGTRCAQMTIFYDGKVVIVLDIPDEKAKDIMVISTDNYTAYPSSLAVNSANNSVQVPSIVPVIYDLPMTRKASFHWFLEKRKNRIASRAPYQTTYPAATINMTIDESWHGSP